MRGRANRLDGDVLLDIVSVFLYWYWIIMIRLRGHRHSEIGVRGMDMSFETSLQMQLPYRYYL